MQATVWLSNSRKKIALRSKLLRSVSKKSINIDTSSFSAYVAPVQTVHFDIVEVLLNSWSSISYCLGPFIDNAWAKDSIEKWHDIHPQSFEVLTLGRSLQKRLISVLFRFVVIDVFKLILSNWNMLMSPVTRSKSCPDELQRDHSSSPMKALPFLTICAKYDPPVIVHSHFGIVRNFNLLSAIIYIYSLIPPLVPSLCSYDFTDSA